MFDNIRSLEKSCLHHVYSLSDKWRLGYKRVLFLDPVNVKLSVGVIWGQQRDFVSRSLGQMVACIALGVPSYVPFSSSTYSSCVSVACPYLNSLSYTLNINRP